MRKRRSFDAAEKEIRAIDETVVRRSAPVVPNGSRFLADAENRAAEEERAFADYVMGKVSELRAGEQNVDMTNNGAIIPTTIANRIIKAVKDRCPILAGATVYNVKGKLKVPVWGKANTTHDIAVGYQTEFTEITADSGKFTSVDLDGYLAGALTLIGRSVENNGSFSVVDFIVSQMAEEIASFLEKELLNGTSGKATGALSTTTSVTAAAAAAITADELIDLQAKVKQVYQNGACWTMHPGYFHGDQEAQGRQQPLSAAGRRDRRIPVSPAGQAGLFVRQHAGYGGERQGGCSTAITAACRSTCGRISL